MSARSPALIALLIAGGLTGCGATANSAGNFRGDQAKVAAAVDALSSAASSHDAGKICAKIFAPTISAKLKSADTTARHVGSCTSVVGKQLDTVDTFNVTVQSVTINGTTARARVKSTSNGKDRTDTLGLVRLTDGSWRVASLG